MTNIEQIEKRDLITKEYIEYLKKHDGIIKPTDKTKMKHSNNYYSQYLNSEQQTAIRIIEEKKYKHIELNEVEQNRLDNYNKILEIKYELIQTKKIRENDISTKEFIKYLKEKNGVIDKLDYMKSSHFTYYDYFINERKTVNYLLETKEKLTISEENRIKNYNKIFDKKEILRYLNLFEGDYDKAYNVYSLTKKLKNRKKRSENNIFLNDNLKIIIKNLGLSIDKINENLIFYDTLEEVIRHNFANKTIKDKKYIWLEELFNQLIDSIDYKDSADKTIELLANKIIEFKKYFNLNNEEIKLLLNLLNKYIILLRKFYILDYKLENNQVTKLQKSNDYNLSQEEIKESYYIKLKK